ncbi:hypothetical protein F5X99DRAFT_68487 [Biscogniauxia marginata]|nr:hypothetical protein F5X99DRAFT_68487 [Biscogniauxia marginata]
MKYTVAIFALFAVAMGSPVKTPKTNKVRQAQGVSVQGSAMTTANGDVVPFDTAGVYKAATDAGL